MPQNELHYQRRIIEEVTSAGGYGKKLTSAYAVGVPDLLLIHRDFGSCFMEVKVLEIPEHQDRWDRKVGVTDIQAASLRKIATAGGLAAVGVIVRKQARLGRGKTWFAVLPHNIDRMNQDTPSHEIRPGSGMGALAQLRGLAA